MDNQEAIDTLVVMKSILDAEDYAFEYSYQRDMKIRALDLAIEALREKEQKNKISVMEYIEEH